MEMTFFFGGDALNVLVQMRKESDRLKKKKKHRVKDGERMEGWRGLEEILEKTEQRLSLLTFFSSLL